MVLKIGALANMTGTNAPTIRYYEQIGLLPRGDRRAGGHRTYDDEDVKRLTFIRRCRDVGFPIDQVRTIAALMSDRDHGCMEARDLAQEHLAAVRAKLVELKALERSIAGLLENCDGAPGPGAETA